MAPLPFAQEIFFACFRGVIVQVDLVKIQVQELDNVASSSAQLSSNTHSEAIW